MTIGEKIQKLRKQHSLSQEALAEKVTVTRQTISKWELGVSQSYRYHINPTRTFAQPIQPEGWITRKGGMRPVVNSTPFVRQYGILLTNEVLFYAKRSAEQEVYWGIQTGSR